MITDTDLDLDLVVDDPDQLMSMPLWGGKLRDASFALLDGQYPATAVEADGTAHDGALFVSSLAPLFACVDLCPCTSVKASR